MAEEKEPERKKLSLQGNKKLSLGSGQDFIKSNRNNIPGTRSVQVETRRKRIVRGGIKQNLNFEGNKFKLNQINSQTSLTEREREARMNALKQGLQDIESKTNNEKFLSKDEININSKSDTIDQNFTSEKKADTDKTKISDNLKERSDDSQTKNENIIHEKTKKQSEAKFNKDEIDVDKRKQKIKITVRRDEPKRRAGKITITDALSGQEARMRSLSAMRRQREKVKTQTLPRVLCW